MTITKAITNIIINLCLVLLGVYIAFKVTWTHDIESLLGVPAFVLVLGCSGMFAITLTKLILPTNPVYDRDNWKDFKKNVGKVRARLIVVTFSSVFLITLSSAFYLYISSVKKHEYYQLTTFGQRQKVRIKDIHYKGKGSPYAFFDFEFNSNLYSDNLDPRQFEIGDSATIIFSTEDPDIVKWADDFDRTNE